MSDETDHLLYSEANKNHLLESVEQDKNFREEETPLSLAQQLFKDKNILTYRPEGMEYNVYRFLRKGQNKILKKLFASKPDPKIARLMETKRGYNG